MKSIQQHLFPLRCDKTFGFSCKCYGSMFSTHLLCLSVPLGFTIWFHWLLCLFQQEMAGFPQIWRVAISMNVESKPDNSSNWLRCMLTSVYLKTIGSQEYSSSVVSRYCLCAEEVSDPPKSTFSLPKEWLALIRAPDSSKNVDFCWEHSATGCDLPHFYHREKQVLRTNQIWHSRYAEMAQTAA